MKKFFTFLIILSATISNAQEAQDLKPEFKFKIIGKILRRDVKEDQPINLNCFK